MLLHFDYSAPTLRWLSVASAALAHDLYNSELKSFQIMIYKTHSRTSDGVGGGAAGVGVCGGGGVGVRGGGGGGRSRFLRLLWIFGLHIIMGAEGI